jgi:LEA14-like dessication related protein
VIAGVWSVAGLPPVLATVMVWAAVVWLSSVAMYVSEPGVKTMEAGVVAVPERATVAWPPAILA